MGQEEVIAGRYARALAELARDVNRIDEVRSDLRALDEILDPGVGDGHVPELLDFLNSPVVTPADKGDAARRIMGKLGIGETVTNFLGVLIERNRVDLLPRIARVFAGLAGELTGECTAVVHTARALTEEQREKLAAALATAFGGPVRIHQRVEPGLLAGARVTVGDRIFDGTVLGRLDSLRHRLVSGGADMWQGALVEAEDTTGDNAN